jgi:hypothetical protein
MDRSSQGKPATHRAVPWSFGTSIGKLSPGLIQGVHLHVSDIVEMDGWVSWPSAGDDLF